jgi:hypothetical protein
MGAAYAILAADASRSARQRSKDWASAREWYQRAVGSFQEISSIWQEAAEDQKRVSVLLAMEPKLRAAGLSSLP